MVPLEGVEVLASALEGEELVLLELEDEVLLEELVLLELGDEVLAGELLLEAEAAVVVQV